MALQVINPQLVTYHKAKEREMDDLTIESCKNNVRTYLTNMQELQKYIDSLQKNEIKNDEQRFLTLTFDDLVNTARDFLTYIKRQQSEWVKKPSDFNTSTFIADMKNMYTNYKSTGEWEN